MSHSKTDSMIVGNTDTFLKELLPIYDAKVYSLAYALNGRGALNEKEHVNKCKDYVGKMCMFVSSYLSSHVVLLKVVGIPSVHRYCDNRWVFAQNWP